MFSCIVQGQTSAEERATLQQQLEAAQLSADEKRQQAEQLQGRVAELEAAVTEARSGADAARQELEAAKQEVTRRSVHGSRKEQLLSQIAACVLCTVVVWLFPRCRGNRASYGSKPRVMQRENGHVQAREDVQSARDLLERADAAAKALTEKAWEQAPCAGCLELTAYVSCKRARHCQALSMSCAMSTKLIFSVDAVRWNMSVGGPADGAVQGGVEGRGAEARRGCGCTRGGGAADG